MPHAIKSNKQPDQNPKQLHGGKDSNVSETPSINLWVGNLPSDITDSDLMNLFGKHGAIDSIASYASRSYAFIYFKLIEDAKTAKDALQGTIVRGNPIKIEFARPAKPCKSLWVSGIGPSVSKEKLDEEFGKFGKIEDLRFLRDRSAAFVDYFKLEDASQALKNMNGKRIGGDHIRVDFLRSQPSRRDQYSDLHEAREGAFLSRSMGPPDSPWMPQDFITKYPEPIHSGSKRQLHSLSSGGRKVDGQPSKVLWVGYPPSVQIDEQMLHNAMILFGEIERIKSFPSRHYSFVEFRSIDEARRAKEGLQGRLFNDPRITIMFSSSELAPGKDYSGFYPGIKGSRPEMFLDDIPFQPAQMDLFSHNRLLAPNNIPGPIPTSGILGSNMALRPFGTQNSSEPPLLGPDFNDLVARHKLPDSISNTQMAGPNWKRLSPSGPALLHSPSPSMKTPIRPVSGAWDVFDTNQIQREPKRSRIDGALPIYDPSFPSQKMDHLDQLYGLGPHADGGTSGPLAMVQGKNHLSPVDTRFTGGRTDQGHPDLGYIWRGIIAKGGTPVCHARCIPFAEGIESEIPDVVNCSARTGLDMLMKHYADAVGFNVVVFLPDSEDDFASYTEFLRYLGTKNRAGVAKFDDGTTLFLVPPSDFLTKVLNITGPERLYGVVLKFPQHVSTSTSMLSQSQSHSQLLHSQYIDRQQISSQTEYSVRPQKEEKVQIDYNEVLREHEDSVAQKHLSLPTSDSLPVNQLTSINPETIPQTGVTLTPELIATLASLLPAKQNSSGLENGQPTQGSSSLRPSLPHKAAPDKIILPQGYDQQAPELTGHLLQQSGAQFNSQAQLLPQLRTYPANSSTDSHSAQGVIDSSQTQDPAFNLPQQVGISSRPSTNFATPSQSGQFTVSPQINQPYHYEIPQNSQRGHGMGHGTDTVGSYGSSVHQQSSMPDTLSNQVQGANVFRPETAMLATENLHELPNQAHQLQSAPYGVGQGTSEVDVDKNQRYQSTLQFAANLLLQIQRQQQTNTQAGQGPENHQ